MMLKPIRTSDDPKNDMSESQALMITINNLIVEHDKLNKTIEVLQNHLNQLK